MLRRPMLFITLAAADVVLITQCVADSDGDPGDAGILVSGNSCRVEDNLLEDNPIGIDATFGIDTIIIHNVIPGYTSAIAGSGTNNIGEVVDLTAVNGEFSSGTRWSNFLQ